MSTFVEFIKIICVKSSIKCILNDIFVVYNLHIKKYKMHFQLGNFFLLRLIASCLFLAQLNSGYGQAFSVKGKVINNENEPLAYVNVVLLKKSDSLAFKGNSTSENGSFEIEQVPQGDYIVQFSYVGFEKKFKEVAIASSIDIGVVELKPESEKLDDVTITAKRNVPRLKRLADRLVFNVAQTPLTETNIWELLNRTPGIILVNNEITFKGSSNIKVLINNRKVSLPKEDILNLLKGTDAGNVASVEIITNPSADYDAEGGTLLNINMSKNIAKGYNASAFTNYELGVYPKYTMGTSHFFKSNKIQLSFSYALSDIKAYLHQNEVVDFFENNEINTIWNSNTSQITDYYRHNTNLFFDYTPDSKNSFSLSVLGSLQPTFSQRYFTDTGINDINDVPQSSFSTFNHVNGDNVNLALNLDYIRNLNEKGSKLIINTGYTYYEKERHQDIDTDFFDADGSKTGDNDFTTLYNQRIHIYNAQVDLNFPFENNAQIETGVKFAAINSLNTIEQPGFDVSQAGENPTANDMFDYNETIGAAYLSYAKDWSKWSLKTGLRAEYTETKGVSDVLGTVNKNDYFEIFPTFYVQYVPGEKHNLSLSYGRRINRPKYAMINPFIIFTGNNMFEQGDPALVPAFSNTLTLSYTFMDSYNFTVNYYFEQNSLRFLTFQNNDSNRIQYLNTNIDRELLYSFDFFTYKTITNFWDMNIYSSYFYDNDRFKNVENEDQFIENDMWTLYLEAKNNFNISSKAGITAAISGVYVSKIVFGNSVQDDYSNINASVSMKLLSDKGLLTLGVQDIFNNTNTRNNRVFDMQSSTNFTRRENRLFTLSFRYKFGNTRLENNENTKETEERNRLN